MFNWLSKNPNEKGAFLEDYKKVADEADFQRKFGKIGTDLEEELLLSVRNMLVHNCFLIWTIMEPDHYTKQRVHAKQTRQNVTPPPENAPPKRDPGGAIFDT